MGERSIYEVALTHSEHPASWYLPVMSSFANQVEALAADGLSSTDISEVSELPPLLPVIDGDHTSACHYNEERAVV